MGVGGGALGVIAHRIWVQLADRAAREQVPHFFRKVPQIFQQVPHFFHACVAQICTKCRKKAPFGSPAQPEHSFRLYFLRAACGGEDALAGKGSSLSANEHSSAARTTPRSVEGVSGRQDALNYYKTHPGRE